MNTIKIFLATDGSTAVLQKDFSLYQGSFQNKLLNVYIPTSVLAPQFTSWYINPLGAVTVDTLQARTAVKIGALYTSRSGKIAQTQAFYMRPVKVVTVNGTEYQLFERQLPSAFTTYFTPELRVVTNAVNIVDVEQIQAPVGTSYYATTDYTTAVGTLNEAQYVGMKVVGGQTVYTVKVLVGTTLMSYYVNPDDQNLVSSITQKTVTVITSQVCNMAVEQSDYLDNDEVDEPSELETLNAQVAQNTDNIDNLLSRMAYAEADIDELQSGLAQEIIDRQNGDTATLNSTKDWANNKFIALTEKGAGMGVATLDANRKLTASQIPDTIPTKAYVDTEVADAKEEAITEAQAGAKDYADDNFVPLTQKGVANGVATLGADGFVPASQIPGAVDEIINAYTILGYEPFSENWLSLEPGGSPLTPETGTIYVVQNTGEYQYHPMMWTGISYVDLLSPDLSSYATKVYVDTEISDLIATYSNADGEIGTATFVSNESFGSLGYHARADVSITGLRGGDFLIVSLSQTEWVMNNVAPFCEVAMVGSVPHCYLYAKTTGFASNIIDRAIGIKTGTTGNYVYGTTNASGSIDLSTYATKTYADNAATTAQSNAEDYANTLVDKQVQVDFVGTVSGTVITFALDSTISTFAFTHLHKYLAHLSLPISTVGGVLPDAWTIRFVDKDENDVNLNCIFHRDNASTCTVGDICELQSYDSESGYEWDLQLIYYQYTENNTTVRVFYTYDATRETVHSLTGGQINTAIANSALRPNDSVICTADGNTYLAGHIYKITGEYVGGLLQIDTTDITAGGGTEAETLSISTTDWTADTTISPFAYKAVKTLATTLGTDAILSLSMDAVEQATSGIVLGDITGQSLTLYAISAPTQTVTATILIGA